jgi:hypothetical protein
MSANSLEGRLDMPREEKYHVHETEDVGGDRVNSVERRQSMKHGDRALALIGDERVFLTEEDVSVLSRYINSDLVGKSGLAD